MLKLRHCIQAFLLFMIATIVGFLLVEAGLRISNISYIQAYTYDENLGNVLRANAKGWYRKEGRTFIEINSDGLRDNEYSLVKPADTFRIAVLGDSFAEALQVTAKKTFWSVMERELNSCISFAGKNVEVINFGVSGYGTAQELLILRHQAQKYDPDLIVLAFLTGNDICNNSKALSPDKMRPFFVYRDGILELDLSFRNLPQYVSGQSWVKRNMRSASTHLYFVQLLYELKLKWEANSQSVSRQSAQNEQRSDQDKRLVHEPGLNMQVYQEVPSPDWENAWKITEDLIIMMSDEVEKMGAGFLVVTLSNGIQVHPDPSVRRAFMDGAGINNLFYPDERIRKVCTDAGISVLTLAQLFQAYAEKNDVCLHGFTNGTMCGGHWNEEGHLYAGRLIADEICKTGREYTR